MSSSKECQVTEFNTFFQSSNFHKTVCTSALKGQLNPHFRSVTWRILLGLLPPPAQGVKEDPELMESWKSAADKERERFQKKLAVQEAQQNKASGVGSPGGLAGKKKKTGPRFGDDSSSDDSDVEVVTDDPLSSKKDSEWQKKFEMQKLIDTIDADLDRLWLGDLEFFEEPAVRACVRKVLVCYTSETNLRYRQGMHEIAALVYYWVLQSADEATKAKAAATEGESTSGDHAKWVDFISYLCNHEHAISDSFAIFNRIMSEDHLELSILFDSSKSREVKDLGENALKGTPSSLGTVTNNEGVEMAQYIQTFLLKKHNPALAKHLNANLDISPQSYGIRWLRLMFLREVSIPQCAEIWDAVFADYAWTRRKGQPYEIQYGLLKYVAGAMLLYIGSDLLDRDDYGECLQRLMKYPPIEGVAAIIVSAVKLLDEQDMMTMLDIQPPRAPSPKTASPQQQHQTVATPVAAPGAAASTTGGAGSSSTDTAQLRDKQMRMGMILDSVVQRMEAKWFPAGMDSSKAAQEELEKKRNADEQQKVEEDYIMAIAELKRVKDVLLNTIQE